MIVSLAFWILGALPAEVINWMPPMTMKTTAMRPLMRMTVLTIFMMRLGKSSSSACVLLLLHPDAARTSSGRLESQLLFSRARVGIGIRRFIAVMVTARTIVRSLEWFGFMELLCNNWCISEGGIICVCCICVRYGIKDEGNDHFGKSNNDEADKSVKNGFFGFFDFSGIARRRHIGNTAEHYEDN